MRHAFKEFSRHITQNGIREALGHTERFLLWQVTKRLPVPVLRWLFELNTHRPNRSDSNPLRLVWVPPEVIEYVHVNSPTEYGIVFRKQRSNQLKKFEETIAYKSLYKRFKEDQAWEDTLLFKYYSNRIDEGNPFWRCRTPEELTAYCREIDELYDKIKQSGYKSQRQLLEENPTKVKKQNNDAMHPILNEISVTILTDGEIAKSESGIHRLALAQILEINEVPVIVRARHEQWQAIRDEIIATEDPKKLSKRARSHLQHPDLTDIVPRSWGHKLS